MFEIGSFHCFVIWFFVIWLDSLSSRFEDSDHSIWCWNAVQYGRNQSGKAIFFLFLYIFFLFIPLLFYFYFFCNSILHLFFCFFVFWLFISERLAYSCSENNKDICQSSYYILLAIVVTIYYSAAFRLQWCHRSTRHASSLFLQAHHNFMETILLRKLRLDLKKFYVPQLKKKCLQKVRIKFLF